MKGDSDNLKKIGIQFSKFGVVGALAFLVDLGFFQIGLDYFGFSKYLSALFSFPFAVTFSWLGNRTFTFRGEHQGSMHAQWLKFFSVCAIGLVLNRGAFSFLVYNFSVVDRYPVLGLVAGTAVGMFFNFIFARRLVFR